MAQSNNNNDNNNQSQKPNRSKSPYLVNEQNQQIRRYNNRSKSGKIIWGLSGADIIIEANAMATHKPEYNSLIGRVKLKHRMQTNVDGTKNSYANAEDLTNDNDNDVKADPNDETDLDKTRRKAFMSMYVAKYLIMKNPKGEWINIDNQTMNSDQIESIIDEMEEWLKSDQYDENFNEAVNHWAPLVGHISPSYGGIDKEYYTITCCNILPQQNAYNSPWIRNYEGIYMWYI